MREAKGLVFRGEVEGMKMSRKGGLLEGKLGDRKGEEDLTWRELVERVREDRAGEALSGDAVLTDSFRYVQIGIQIHLTKVEWYAVKMSSTVW